MQRAISYNSLWLLLSYVGNAPRPARRTRAAPLRRGGYHPPALTVCQRVMEISPAGDLLCPRRQSRQNATGGGSRAFTMPYPASPGPPFDLRGSHQGVKLYPSGADKDQDTVPCAARCRSVLVEQAHAPTRAVAPSSQPSRGGSVVAPPPWLVSDTQNFREHTPAPGPYPLAVSSTAGPFRHRTFQVTVPQGGTSNRGAEAPLIGRFKGMRYLGEGGNRNPPSPRQLFGNFLSAQKVTRPGAKHSFLPIQPNRMTGG